VKTSAGTKKTMLAKAPTRVEQVDQPDRRQGRDDVVCPMDSAWALHRTRPEAEQRTWLDSGHAAHEPGIVHERW